MKNVLVGQSGGPTAVYSSLETKYVVVDCDRNSILYVIGTNSILNKEGTGMDLILSITAPSFLLFHDVH